MSKIFAAVFVSTSLLSGTLLFSSCDDLSSDPNPLEVGGPILLISNKSGTRQLYSMNIDGTEVKQLTDDDSFPLNDAKYSPDGTRVLVTSSVGGYSRYGPSVYTMNLNGTARVKITQSRADAPHYASGTRPVWSPNANRIAFSRLMIPELLGNYDIFTVDASGASELQITHTIDTTENLGCWTPDGMNLVCAIWTLGGGSPLEFARLAKLDMTGTILASWYEPSRSSSAPIVSPSGKELVFRSNDGGSQDIYFLRIDTLASRVKLTGGIYMSVDPVAWSPDGGKVLFNVGHSTTEEGPFGRVLIVDVNSRQTTDVTPFPDSIAYTVATSWRMR